MKKVDQLSVDPRHIEFLYEQDGEIERELKRRLVPLLEAAEGVRAAYLAVADYHDGSRPSVILCVSSDEGVDDSLIGKVGEVFGEIFGGSEHLDFLAVDARQESEVRAVCAPFFGD